MTRKLSILTARKSLGSLSGLFSLALLLFSATELYAQGGCGLDSSITYSESSQKTAPDTASSAADFREEKIAVSQRISAAFKQMEWIGLRSRSVDDAQREKEAEDAYKNALAEYKEKFQIDYDKDKTESEKTRSSNEKHPLTRGGKARNPFEESRINASEAMLKWYASWNATNNLSPEINLLDAATRKSGADKNSDNKQRAKFLEIKQKYDETITDLAKIYVDTEENPNADQSVISSIDSELSKGDNYFTERFRLELDKLKNHISDEVYQLKKTEIDDRYAQKYMLAAAHLGADDVAWMLGELSSRVDTLGKLVDTLKENEPVLRGWFLGVSGFATSFLVYLLWRKKESEESHLRRQREWREASEFELMELKKRQLENANIKAELEIEKEKIELERLKKTEIIIFPTADEIKKYSAPAFFRQSDKNKDKRDNYSGH